MGMKLLGISTSPRINGNSDILLREALSAAETGGAETEYVNLRDYIVAGCISCGACDIKGYCVIEDDYQQLMAKMLDADRLIFSTPIYFMHICAQGKALIDRCQCLWAKKYVLGQKVFEAQEKDRRAMVIAVGGSNSKNMFPCIELSMKYYFEVLEMKYSMNFFINNVDEKGAMLERKDAVERVGEMALELISSKEAVDDKIKTILLT